MGKDAHWCQEKWWVMFLFWMCTWFEMVFSITKSVLMASIINLWENSTSWSWKSCRWCDSPFLPSSMFAFAEGKIGKAQTRTEGTPDFLLPDYYPPPYAGEACKLCGWTNFAPGNCTVEMSDKPCKWMEKQEEFGPRGEDIFSLEIWNTKRSYWSHSRKGTAI